MLNSVVIKTKASIEDTCYFYLGNDHSNKRHKAVIKHISIEIYKTKTTVEYSVETKDGIDWTIDESDLIV